MKQILTLIFCALCAISYGQFAPTGTKTNFKNGIALGSKDSTAFGTNDSLAVTIDRNGRFMYRGLGAGAYWKVVQSGTDTVADSRFVRLQTSNLFRQDGKFWISDTGYSSILFRSPKFYGDTLQATGSGGGVISTNAGTTVASWGAGGSTEFTAHGFAGYNANRSASYTPRSFTDFKFVDSSTIHNQTGISLSAQTAKFYITDTIKTDGVVTAAKVVGTASGSGIGVNGNSTSGSGVAGLSVSGSGVLGTTTSGFGVYATTSGDNGVPLTSVVQNNTATSAGYVARNNGSGNQAEWYNSSIMVASMTNGGSLSVTGLTVSGSISGTLSTAAQPNITSVGTLTGLTVTGPLTGTSAEFTSGIVTTTGSFNNTITSLIGNNSTVLNSASATSGFQIAINQQNTSGRMQLGVEGSVAGTLASGNTAYSTNLLTVGNTDIALAPNQSVSMLLKGSTQNVLINTTTDNGTDKLQVNGGIKGSTILSSGTLGINGVADNVKSGTYTPTATVISNISSVTVNQFMYTRVGNVVTVTGDLTIGPTSASSSTMLYITLPFSSNIAAQNDVIGGVSSNNMTADNSVYGDTVGDRAIVGFTNVNTSLSSFSVYFQYIIK